MFRILVVDDQAKIREGLQAILRQSRETMETETASNGLEALQILQRKKCHLVITDIRMPDMDGIALMEAAKKYYPDIPFLVVSGYDDFSYAQKAIESGARAYLLKPLERSQLLKAVDRIYEEYQADQVRKGGEQNEDRTLEQLSLYMKGNAKDSGLWKRSKGTAAFLAGEYRLILFLFPQRRLNEQEQRVRMQLISKLRKNIGDIPCLLFEEDRELVLIHSAAKNGTGWPESIWRTFPVSVAVGEWHTGFGELREAYAQAREIGVHHVLFPGKAFLTQQDIDVLKTDFTVPYREVERICDIIGFCEDSDITAYISRIFDRSVLSQYRIGYTLALCDSLYRSLRAAEAPLRDEGKTAGLDIRKLNSPMEYGSMREYLLALQENALRLHHLLRDYKNGYRENAEMEAAISYIRKNYHKQLTLAMVSNGVSLNYAYFSNVFRKYTGKTFMEYLRDTRMEEGKRLLAETDQKIGQVAESVGYDSYKSFSRAFKETVGITPAEYRKNSRIMKREDKHSGDSKNGGGKKGEI